MLVGLLYAVAIVGGAGFLIGFGRSVYHSISQRGSTKTMLVSGVAGVAMGGLMVVALIIADRLQDM